MADFLKEKWIGHTLCLSLSPRHPTLLIAAFSTGHLSKNKKDTQNKLPSLTCYTYDCVAFFFFFSEQIRENSEIPFAAIQWSHWILVVLLHLSPPLLLPHSCPVNGKGQT